jgi:hypothetical protein
MGKLLSVLLSVALLRLRRILRRDVRVLEGVRRLFRVQVVATASRLDRVMGLLLLLPPEWRRAPPRRLALVRVRVRVGVQRW